MTKEKQQAIQFASTILSPYMPEVTPQVLMTLENPSGKKKSAIEQRYKVKEVAETLHCSIKHVWNLIERGQLNPERSAGITRIKESELLRLLNS